MQTLMSRDEVIRRESWIRGGWNLTDDDVPNVPELTPIDSPQARRAQRLQEHLQIRP
ncbi:MAG: hypothetical protein RLZZ32_971 [Cyanobacteriota bacterium]|jgi:hypothetical protein